MTAFDMFQEATCDLGDGNRAAARRWLDKAIAQIDKDGVDAHMRADLVGLRDTL